MKNKILKILSFILLLAVFACLLSACKEEIPEPDPDPTPTETSAVVSKHTEKYFAGENLDLDNGQVKITRADGTSFTRKLNDTNLKVSYDAADFKTAGTKTISFVYTEESTQYSGSFTVEVYAIANIKFVAPTKTNYRNYESSLNLKGGSIRLSNADGTFSRTVELSDSAVSVIGYDPTKATEADHRTEPLTQVLTVNFGSIAPQSFEVKILYTDVLKINQFIQEISNIDWSSETTMPTISKEVGENAMETMLTYTNMDAEDRYEITDENLLQLSRTALAYSYGLWYEEFMKYGGAFTDDPDNGFTYTLTSYSALKSETQKLNNTNNELYKIGQVVEAVLRNEDIATEEMGFALVHHLANEAWGDDITLAEYQEVMSAYGEDIFDFESFYSWFTFLENQTIQGKILPLFDFMLNLHENMSGISHDFDFSTTEHNDKVRTTIDLILSEDNIYNYSEYAQIYELVDSWLGGKGFFNLLYTYIYTYEPTDIAALNALSMYVLPVELQELNHSIEECLYYIAMFASDLETAIENSALQIDTSDFLKNYFYAQDRNAALKAAVSGTKEYYFYNNIKLDIGDGELYTFDELLYNIRYTTGGYYSLLGGGVNNATVENWLKTFIDALYSGADSNPVVADLLYDYARMSVADQASIVSALHAYYDSGLTTYAFKHIIQRDVYYIMGYTDDELELMYQQGYITEEDYASLNDITSESTFLRLVSDYYNAILQNEQTKTAFNSLLLAMDEYLNYGAMNGASNDYQQNQFKKVFETIIAGLTDSAALTEFNEHFGLIYGIYEARFNVNTVTPTPDFGEHQPLVDELLVALEYALTGIGYSYDYVSDLVILIPHEKVEELVAELLSKIGDDEDLMYLYSNYACFEFNESVMYPLEYAVGFSRAYYYDHVLALGDAYTPELRQFLADCYDTVVACFYEKEEATGTPTFNDFTGLYATALAWVNLTDEEFLTFYMLDLDYTAFYQYTLNYAMTALDTRLSLAVKELAKHFFYVVDYTDGSDTVTLPDNLMSAYLTVLSGITMDLTDMSEADLINYYNGLEDAAEDLREKIDLVKAAVAAFGDADNTSFAYIEDIYNTLVTKSEAALASAEAILATAE